MSINYLEVPSVSVQEIIDDEGVSFEVEVEEATFTKSTGCGPDLSVEQFSLVSWDDYIPKYLEIDIEDPVIVERHHAECSYGREEINLLQMEKSTLKALVDQLQMEKSELSSKNKENVMEIVKLTHHTEMQDKLIAHLKLPWYRRVFS